MNQTNSQMQFLQMVCVVLVMATLIGLIAAYMMYRDVGNLEQQLADAKVQTDLCKSDRVQLSNDLKVLKNLAGYPIAEVGEDDAIGDDTIVGKARSDITQLVGARTRLNLREALADLHDRLVNVTDERNKLKEQLEKLAAGPNTN